MRFPVGSYSHTAVDYARKVVAGKIPACLQMRLACKRTIDDLARADLIFSQPHVDHVCEFIESLVHIKAEWAGAPIRLEPFQIWILASLFGFLRKADRLRKYSDAFILLPRKNGKSLLAAGIALYMCFADNEPGAEVYLGASNLDQAKEVFEPVQRMAELTPGLIESYDIEVMAQSVFSVTKKQRIQRVIGKTKDGSSPHLGICDELHQHKDATQVQAFRTGRGARRQPLPMMISTAGFDLAGICRSEQLDAEAILKGDATGDNVFSAIWTLDPEDDWRDFDLWAKANPCYPITPSERFLREAHSKALQSPANQAFARTKYLNQWVASAAGWLNMSDWTKAADRSLDINDLRGSTAYLAIDLSTKQDLTAIVAVVPLPDGRRAIFPFLFAPAGAVDGSPNAPAYASWVDSGALVQTEGTASSFAEAEAQIEWLMSHFRVEMAVFDQWQGEGLRQRLEAAGLATSIWQANNRGEWTRAMDDFEADLKNGLLTHPGNPCLDWMAANICAKEQGVTRIPVKPHKDKKIDGMIAALMAYAASNVPAAPESAKFEVFYF